MVSVICGVLIIAFAFCCAIETDSDDNSKMPTKAYIPVTESETKKEQTDTETKAEVRKEIPAEAEADESEYDYVEDAQPAEKALPYENEPDDVSRTVYITKTGKKYHYSYFCSSTDFYECTLEQALERGLEPCQKCVK